MRFTLPLLFIACFVLACPGQPTTKEPVASDGGVTDGVETGQQAFVLSMYGESGAFGVVNTSTRKVRAQLGPASNDAVARHFGGHIYIINRLTHDNIQVMDAKNWTLHKQYSVGPKSNPQDIVVLDETKAYVSRLASDKLLIVAPLTGQKLGEIDLGSLAETSDKVCQEDAACESKKCIAGKCARDGLPELARMHLYKGKLFVLAQRLDRNARFDPKDTGMIAVIDTKTDKLVQTMPTKGRNPIQIIPVDGGRRIYVGQVGRWLDGQKPVLDGVIEAFDLDSLKSEGVVATEQDLGGNLSSFVISSSTQGHAIRSNGSWQTELVSFSLKTGKVEQVLASSACVATGACFGFFQVAANGQGEIYLVDRDLKRPGIRIFDANTGKETTPQPLDVGLPPSFILFFP